MNHLEFYYKYVVPLWEKGSYWFPKNPQHHQELADVLEKEQINHQAARFLIRQIRSLNGETLLGAKQ